MCSEGGLQACIEGTEGSGGRLGSPGTRCPKELRLHVGTIYRV